jgi:hypothetical protein
MANWAAITGGWSARNNCWPWRERRERKAVDCVMGCFASLRSA